MNQTESHEVITLGVTGTRFFKKNNITPIMEMDGVLHIPTLYSAQHITQDVFHLFDTQKTPQIFLVYMAYTGSVKWTPTIKRLLPVEPFDVQTKGVPENIVYYPSPSVLFHLLVPQYTLGVIYSALMQAYASEHSARMGAMQSATRNADELLSKLKATYNIVRQSAITQEIAEITGSAQALTNRLEDGYGYC